jgi:hypothetical protein
MAILEVENLSKEYKGKGKTNVFSGAKRDKPECG